MKKFYALLAVLVLVLGCGTGGAPYVEEAATQSTVVFEVSGPATVDVTYGVGGNQQQELGVAAPWTKTTTADGVVIAALVAQSKAGAGEITCRVLVDGEQRSKNTSTGQFATVTCTS